MKEHKKHWELVYETKQSNEVSWTQEIPTTSLEFLHQFDLSKTAKIIDIGGGDSRLVDYLLQEGYENISVLDISKKALARAKKRLGKAPKKVNWIVSDITEFKPTDSFDLWHDRATFHFLITKEQVEQYLSTAKTAVTKYLIVATFSETGPQKCSGLEIKQYSELDLEEQFKEGFDKIKCKQEDHITPSHTVQNFTFCSFKKHQN
jgi:cyclopropane fatty-acyl-phospholipid synthase-like methyltransferase